MADQSSSGSTKIFKIHKGLEPLISGISNSENIQAIINRKCSKKVDLSNSQYSTIACFSLPLFSRPVTPISVVSDNKWKRELISVVIDVDGSPIFAPDSEWKISMRTIIENFDIPLLSGCIFQRQKNPNLSLNILNLYILVCFGITEWLEPCVRGGDAELLRTTSQEISDVITTKGYKKKEETNLGKFKSLVLALLEKLERKIAHKSNEVKQELFDGFRKDLLNYIETFLFRIKDEKMSITEYIEMRMREQPWFTINLWKILNSAEKFGALFIGQDKELGLLEALSGLHILLTQDIIRFSKNESTGYKKWNIVYILRDEFGLSLDDAFKVVVVTLENVRSEINSEIDRLDSVQDKLFQAYKKTTYSYALNFFMDCITASVVWGSKTKIFARDN